ncbi:MAG TPA: Crp/Fnr family transcriptional regulator [Abditibacteriaceae bacterium]|jgi:CRP-like cAMP-binding protein
MSHFQDVLDDPQNHILASLPRSDYERLRPHLHLIDMHSGDSLHEIGALLEHVYFPNSGMISLVLTSNEGTNVEVGIVGREGMAGTASVLGGAPAISQSIVQIEGTAMQLPTSVLLEEFEHSKSLRRLLLGSLQALVTQTAQTALCNRLHSVEERLSRWLLVVSDRVGSDEFDLTQEFIAHMLGTRRSGVTVACGQLRSADLIEYSRGRIQIMDRQGLIDTSCECYAVIQKQFEYLLS